MVIYNFLLLSELLSSFMQSGAWAGRGCPVNRLPMLHLLPSCDKFYQTSHSLTHLLPFLPTNLTSAAVTTSRATYSGES